MLANSKKPEPRSGALLLGEGMAYPLGSNFLARVTTAQDWSS